MNKKVVAAVLIAVGLIVIGVSIFFITRKTVSFAALRVSASPSSQIFLNNKPVGQTVYYDEKLVPGDYNLKIVPPSGSNNSWSTLIKLTPSTLTAVNYDFGASESLSGGEVLTLEKLGGGGDKTEIYVLTTPNGASVKLDNQDQGVGPVNIKNVAVSEHDVLVSKEGYKDRLVRGKTIAGYRLIINVQLAQSPTETTNEATPSATPSTKVTPGSKVTPTPTKKPALTPSPTKAASSSATLPTKPYAVIKETPTGWLRVREAPSTTATEAARVNPGEMYPLLDEQSGWAKIKYATNKEGWVSDQYVEKVK